MRLFIFFIFLIFSSAYIYAQQEKPELKVALTFDYEGCSEIEMETVFELIERHNATATFFVTGKTAETNPEGVRQLFERNYSLGLHTYHHNFPIFYKGDANTIASAYKESPEQIWNRSFKTKEAFYEDLVLSRAALMEAVNNETIPVMFRSPSLTVNWTHDSEYFEALKKAGIDIDSSIYQNFSNPRPPYDINGVLEVPVMASDFDFKRRAKIKGLAKNSSIGNAPLVLFFHPHNMKGEELLAVDNLLHILEDNYKVEYIKIDDARS